MPAILTIAQACSGLFLASVEGLRASRCPGQLRPSRGAVLHMQDHTRHAVQLSYSACLSNSHSPAAEPSPMLRSISSTSPGSEEDLSLRLL